MVLRTPSRDLPRVASPPLWLRGLAQVAAELRLVRFPSSSEDGLRETLRLSDWCLNLIRARLQTVHTTASPAELDLLAYHEACIEDQLRARLAWPR